MVAMAYIKKCFNYHFLTHISGPKAGNSTNFGTVILLIPTNIINELMKYVILDYRIEFVILESINL